MLLGLIGDGREYVSFSIARGTWHLTFVVMIDVVIDLQMLLILLDVLFLPFTCRVIYCSP